MGMMHSKTVSSKKEKGTRTGFTTGACSAAAAKACVHGLITGNIPENIATQLPNGDWVTFAVAGAQVQGEAVHRTATAYVQKFAGDDPDCTDGAHLTATLRIVPQQAGCISYQAGSGVGTVTMAGLGLEVGKPAINPVPRQNIADNIRQALADLDSDLLQQHGIEVTISVPDGEIMARKTTNARLGILGGISILGTTGIVQPYSTSAWRASVVQGIQVAASLGHNMVALTTGGRTETFAMQTLRQENPDLPNACFIQMGDFLRYALDEVVTQGIETVVLGVMVGKLTKIAQGETITHANRNVVNTDLVANIARSIGASEADCIEIANAKTARFSAELMTERGLGDAFHTALAQAAIDTLTAPERYGNAFKLRVLVCDFDNNTVADVSSAPTTKTPV